MVAPAASAAALRLWRLAVALTTAPLSRPAMRVVIDLKISDSVPRQVSGQDSPEGITSFEDVDLPPSLMENVKRCKYTKPTPVQV